MKHSRSKRALCLIGVLLMIFSLLTACGSSAKQKAEDSVSMGGVNYSTATTPTAEPSAPTDDRAEFGYDSGTKGESLVDKAISGSGTVPTSTNTNPTSDAKLIYTASLTLETTSFDEANAGLKALTEQLGGYFERNEISNYSGDYRSAYFVVRVPASSFETFCEKAGEISHLTYITKSAQDISEQYYDTEIRLETQQTKYERLLALLEKAAVMEDIISLENAISETALQIDQLTGALRNYDSLVGYSTVSVQLSEVYRITEEEAAPITFGARLVNAFSNGLKQTQNGLENLVLFVARNIIGILIFAGFVTVVTLVTRKTIRRMRAPKGNPPEPPAK